MADEISDEALEFLLRRAGLSLTQEQKEELKRVPPCAKPGGPTTASLP